MEGVWERRVCWVDRGRREKEGEEILVEERVRRVVRIGERQVTVVPKTSKVRALRFWKGLGVEGGEGGDMVSE